jgi:hypothetical protein
MGHIDPTAVDYLNIIVEVTGCSIVISSSWRILCNHEKLAGWLVEKGFLYPHKIIDSTGRNAKDARGGEIQDWLDAHPEVTKYAILDDDSEDIIGSYTTKKHPQNFVHTTYHSGLTEKEVQMVTKILGIGIDSK